MSLQNDWRAERLPPEPVVDSWARSCVPVRKAGSNALETKTKKSGNERDEAVALSRQTPVKKMADSGLTTASTMRYRPSSSDEASRIWTLQGAEVDMAESSLREAKESQLRQKREETARQNERIKGAEQKEAKLSKFMNDLSCKPYTFDSDGNVLWIQPPNTEKLPNGLQQMAVNLTTKGPNGRADPEQKSEKAKSKVKKKETSSAAAVTDVHDGVLRLATQQPSMMDAMALEPGVSLIEKGKHKTAPIRSNTNMTRAEYMKLVGNTPASTVGVLNLQVETTLEAQEYPIGDLLNGREGDLFDDIATAQELSKGATSPTVPASAHSVKNKRLAIGCRLGTRDRLPISGTARMVQRFGPSVPPQPPIGATMGHGLIGEHDEFYFPNDPPKIFDEEDSPRTVSGKKLRPLSEHKLGGKLTGRNHQLVSELKDV